MNKSIFNFLAIFAFIIPVASLYAQEDSLSNTSIALSKQVINPSTLLWQIQLEEKVITKFENSDDLGQKFRLRLIIPVDKGELIHVKQLLRFIGYYNTVPDHGSGFGDITWNQFFILQEKAWGDWGLGYNLQIPTAKNENFGSQQWSLGPAFTITFKDLGEWEMYYIIQNFFSISENDKYGQKATMVFQPNIFYTWPSGIYTGIEPLWQYDFKNQAVDLPLNWRLGYIYQKKGFKYNVYVEPEWKTYRSDNFAGNNENFAVKLGFRIFLPEKKK